MTEPAPFSPKDASYVCDLLRLSKTNPDSWTRQERRAVSRLFVLAGRQSAPSAQTSAEVPDA